MNEINTNHTNPKSENISSFLLSEKITATDSVEEALRDVSYCILSIPTQSVRSITYNFNIFSIQLIIHSFQIGS